MSQIESKVLLLNSQPSTSTPPQPSPRLSILDGTFFTYVPQYSTDSTVVGICNVCAPKKIEVKGYNKCSSNFLSHLKRIHGDECVEEYRRHLKMRKLDFVKNASEVVVPAWKTKKTKIEEKEQINMKIMNYFINAMIPLSTIEDKYFLQLFSDKSSGIATQTELRDDMHAHFNLQMADIRMTIREIDFVCTVLSVWRSRHSCLLGVTAHWINKDLERKSIAIACRKVGTAIQAFEELSEEIQDINMEFGLTNNSLAATITNSDSTFLEPLKKFGVYLPNIDMNKRTEQEILVKSEFVVAADEYYVDLIDATIPPILPTNLTCCAHMLSLCATVEANEVLNIIHTPLSTTHQSLMVKCNALWKAAGQQKTANIIRDTLGYTLSRPYVRDWNSLYNALQQISQIQNKNVQLHKALKLETSITEREFQYLAEYLMCVEPFTEALYILHNRSNAFYGIVLPCLLTLRKKLRRIYKKGLTYCKALTETYIKSLEYRLSAFFNFSTTEAENAAIAALSYPRFRDNWLTLVEVAERTKFLNIFKTIISRELLEKPNSEVKVEDNFFRFETDSDSDLESESIKSVLNGRLKRAELLMQQFFNEESNDLKILNKYVEIKKIFVKYNTPLPSVASVKNIFPHSKLSHNQSWSNNELYEKRLILKYNLNCENQI